MNTPKVYVMGDIHGRFQPVRDFWLRAKLKEKMSHNREDNVLILLGDAGLNYFFNERDDKIKAKLGTYPFTYFIIRGNHEERPSNCMKRFPDKWTTEEFWGGKVFVEKEYPYIKYADDAPEIYHIPYVKIPACLRDDDEYGNIEYEDLIDTYTTLVLPGAYSVDKQYRLVMGYSWFENEQMSSDERNLGRRLVKAIEDNDKECDLVLSHTCPCIYEPTDLFLPMVDQSMVDKTTERYLGEIEYTLNYKAWMWGHYHAYRDYPRTDGRKKLMLFHEAVNLNQFMDEDVPEVL